MKPRILIIVGPTASGKKAFALQSALEFNGEIVSADSRKVYRYLDIGTAKPSAADRSSIPHHLIDILDPDETYSAGQWAADAADSVKDIISRGKLPIISGGTGFYIKAFTDGLSEGIEPDQEIRKNIEDMLQAEGPEALYGSLMAIDPQRAAELHQNDTYRIIRALEIAMSTGTTMNSIRETKSKPACGYDCYTVGISWERETLYKRINERVDAMIEAGLEEEVRTLQHRGYDRSLVSLDTVGYKEWWEYFDGLSARDDCIERMKRNTRRYAKRQLTWFRARNSVHWYDPSEPRSLETMLASVATWLSDENELT